MKARLPSSPFISLAATPDVRQAILTRRTFRTFERRPVPADLRTRVLDAASWAPSAEDADCVRFVVIDDPALKKRLFALTRESKDISNHWEALFRSSGLRGYVQDWTHTPLCIAVCVDPAARPRHIHDNWSHRLAGAAASQNLALAARYHGLAMVMYTHFSQEKLKQLLDVPFEWEVDGVMGIGFPDLGRINPRVLEASLVRLALGELVSSERYGDPAPKELTEERQPPERRAPVAVPDLLARESAAVSAHWFPRYRQGAIDHPRWADVPAAVALIADPTKGGPHIHGEATHVIGGGLAAQNMRLMAHALGLGTSVITHWIEEKVKVLIDCPRDWDLVGVMPVGTPAESPARQRRQVAEVVFQDLFGRRFTP